MLTYDIDSHGELPLYEFLYRCIRDDVLSGKITSGEKLPSKRRLADHLGVSVVTVESAYRQLIAEGYVRSEDRRGYFACEVDGGRAVQASVRHFPLPCAGSHEPEAAERPMVDLTGGTVQEGSFPFDVWARTMRSVLANEPQAKLVGAQDPFGMPELRHALADYLRRERGLAADPSCIVVGAGSQILNMLLVQLLGADRRFAVEDPGYPRLTRLYEACGAQVRHVVLGDSGMSIVDLEAAQADVAHVMPSHQFPTGAVMPVGKRYELLGWASRGERRYLIEDEYDSEFRLAGRPIPTLASVDVAERVVYLNTFTKSLGPAFRVGYMVLPPHLALVLRERFGFYSCTVSAIEQLTLARFIEQGHFERHVNRMRVAYRRLRDALIASLEDALDDRVIVKSADSGLHFLLGLASGKTEKQIVSNLRAKGVEAKSLSSYFQDADLLRVYLAEDGQRWLVVSYSGLSEDEIPHVAEVFGSI